jgi:LmbE family N-acetylglucosaminyl deacetylase
MTQRVLIIAPHPDDESIGCGGTIRLHLERGDEVCVVFLTSGERGIPGASIKTACTLREAEAGEALHVLGVETRHFLRLPDLCVADHLDAGAEQLARLLVPTPPNVIYVPHPAEAHPDHAAALPLVWAALARIPDRRSAVELRGYEVWTPLSPHDWAEDITAQMARKLRAVRCYRSQLVEFRYDRAVRGLNQYRGCLAARSRYAEVFQHLDSTASQEPRVQP